MNGWVCYRHVWKCVLNVGVEHCPWVPIEMNTNIHLRPAPRIPSLGGWHCSSHAHASPRMHLWSFNETRNINPVWLFIVCYFFNYLFSLLFKCYANEAYACVCMCVSQGCVNAVLDTSTCLMDATSLDMVIIMDTQEQRDLTLSQ